ncbi:MAG: exo-alpha-sialidase [Planctomycetia bacterium]|nr:exo-alpha-sialidase [Planctomycetia bacterium]
MKSFVVLFTVGCTALALPQPGVSAGDPDTALPIRVNNPKRLGTWQIAAERIAIGPGYKPSLAMLPDGELVMVALFQEQHEGKLREWTGLWRSTDGGRAWTERERVNDLIGREQWLTSISDGTLFANCHLLAQDANNKNGVTHSYIHRSTDRGRTWQRTRILGKEFSEKSYAMCSRNVVEMTDGTLLLGVGLNERPGRVAYLWTSKDKGRTWEGGPAVTLGRYQGRDYDNFDCFFTEDFTYLTKSGKLLHWIRCGPPSPMHPMNDRRPVPAGDDSIDRTMYCESSDGGRTWGDVRDFGEYGRMYPRVLRLSDGRLLMTYTQRSLVYPIGLRAMVSYDDGATWDFEHDQIVIEGKTPWGAQQGGGFGNTVQLHDGGLISCYSYRAADGQTYVQVVRWKL